MKFGEHWSSCFSGDLKFWESINEYTINKGGGNVLTRVMVLVVCTSSDDALYFCEVSMKIS